MVVTVNTWGYVPVAGVTHWSAPYEGKFKKPLQGKAFYERLGRKDLVAAYEQRMTAKVVMGVLGGAALVGGGVLMYQGISAEPKLCGLDAPPSCSSSRGMTKAVLGLGAALGGGGLIMGARLMSPHPVSGSQARELADDYNKRLRGELGLEDDGAPKKPAVPPVLQAQLGATVGPQGAGLQLSGTF
ncbi:hypothetical protein FGE12_12415 [Aggregicoccus sp. 17bor-14]|nr:hypothetical protein [Aggregicoccus sp. 17bor-14]